MRDGNTEGLLLQQISSVLTVVLAAVTMHIRSPEFNHLITKFVPFDQHFLTSSTPQPLATPCYVPVLRV